jgi:hypothetical protein
MMNSKVVFALVMAVVGTGVVGCDPEGAGASGVITLGEGVDASAFRTINVTAIVDTGKPFDPKQPVFTASEQTDGWLPFRQDLSVTKFPLEYQVSQGVGTTPNEHWRVFAWLTAQDIGGSNAPASAEPYGTATVTIGECGGAFGDYCGVTDGVNITINQTAP